MASVNTNYGASIALQNLNKTNSELERTQNRINTGMKVSSAKDSGAIFAIATSQRAAAASQDAVRSSITGAAAAPPGLPLQPADITGAAARRPRDAPLRELCYTVSDAHHTSAHALLPKAAAQTQ